MAEHRTILVASNDLVEQTQLEEILKEAGYHLLIADDPSMLLQLAEAQRPEAIFLSIHFSRTGGGLLLCRHLKNMPTTRPIPVVILAGRDQPLRSTDGIDGGPDEILLRPVFPSEVLIRLNTVRRLQRYAFEAGQGSRIDNLTGTFNHTYLLDRLKHEVLRANRYGRSLAFLLADLDSFTKFNDKEGTTSGDLMLREVARALTSRLRGVDLVARSGSDEFAIVLPETSLLVARPVAERLCRAVASVAYRIGDDQEQKEMTISIGISGLPHPEIADAPDLLRCARSALSQAHQSGGNQCLLY